MTAAPTATTPAIAFEDGDSDDGDEDDVDDVAFLIVLNVSGLRPI